jgi:hypothetical protein
LTTITGEGIAQLYLENVYQWFGLPEKVIFNKDPVTGSWDKASVYALWTGVSSGTGLDS